MAKPGEYLRETQGLSFGELLERSQSYIKENGYYVKELTLKERDPIKYEVLYAKLVKICVGAKETCKYVSGSYAVREIGENLTALYTAEGDAIALSTGIFLHVHTMGRQIKFIIGNDYETNPGIKEGDHFFNNDPHIGGQHTPDQNIVTPIFYGGRLIAWAAGMTHVVETGAVAPGGAVPDSPNRFSEGLFVTAMKIAENDLLRADWEIMFDRNTRDSVPWILDVKGKMGACVSIREQVKALIDEYGVEYFSEVIREYIEDARRTAKEKLRRLSIPGKYRARNFIDVDCQGRFLLLLQTNVEATLDRDGNMTLDLEGSSPEGPHPFQGSMACVEGSTLCIILQYIFHDCRFNDGTLYAIDLRVPEGSIYCCNRLGGTSRYISWPGCSEMSCVCDIFARVNYMAARFEEVLGPCPPAGPFLCFGAIRDGKIIVGSIPDHGAEGMSALATRDGPDASYMMWQPEADAGDAEMWERDSPFVFLERRRRVLGGGLGKYRGGAGMDTMLFIHPNSSNCEVGYLSGGKYISPNQGLMGGYPGPCAVVNVVKNTNLKELIEKRKPLPSSFGSPTDLETGRYVRGDFDIGGPVNLRPIPLQPFSIVENCQIGGSGFGDPLERDPALIISDLIQGLMSRRAVEEICGVVLEGDWSRPSSLKCNQKETEKVRARIREERKKRGIPAREYIKIQKERVMKGDLPKYPKEMINQLLTFSPRWAAWFRNELGLPEDFKEVP